MSNILEFILVLLAIIANQQTQATPTPAQERAVPSPVVRGIPVQPSPQPFDEKADAKADIDKAVKDASADGIRVLVIWGTNDDSGSKSLMAAKRAPEISKAAFLSDEYKSVNVNIGHLDKNIDLARSYGASLRKDALPALTILDADGKVLANTTAAALRPDPDPSGIDPVKLAAFLKAHQAPAPDAVGPFKAAIKQAKREGKFVFLWFSAPW